MAARWTSGARRAAIASAAILIALAFPASLSAQPGNNGTVKIHDGSTETTPIVRNEPHVCTFHLHFLFADPGQQGTWEVRVWSPGDSGQLALSGTYDTTATGEDREPDTGAFTLPDGHYKLFWTGRNDSNVKHKVFWVECADVRPTETAPPSPSGSVLPTDSVVPSGSVLPTSSAQPTPPSTDTIPTSTPGSVGMGVVLMLLALVGTVALAVPRVLIARR